MASDRSRRVVITGIGLVTPAGNDVGVNWERMLSGQSCISPITEFDVSEYSVKFAGSVRDLDTSSFLTPKEARKIDRFIEFGMTAAHQALLDSDVDLSNEELLTRSGVALGTGIGGIEMIQESCKTLLEKGPKRVSPFLVPGSIANMLSGEVSVKWGLKGPNFAVPTACAAGSHCIGFAAECIRSGRADLMLAGGAERAVTPLSLAGFAAARALSTRNADPQAACRPWDRARDGFVLSEGAGAMVLESLEHAQARGAPIYCELIGFGMAADAHHKTQPLPDGSGAAQAMHNALADAETNPDQVAYINAHGTSTPAGDIAETFAIKKVFGADSRAVAVSSTKSMTGHLLGAAGAVEAIFTLLVLRDQQIPPTINLDDPDEGCDLDYVPHTARAAAVEIAMSNSFGFGGTNATLLFKRF